MTRTSVLNAVSSLVSGKTQTVLAAGASKQLCAIRSSFEASDAAALSAASFQLLRASVCTSGLGLTPRSSLLTQDCRQLSRTTNQQRARTIPPLHRGFSPGHSSYAAQAHKPENKAAPDPHAESFATETVHPEFDHSNDSHGNKICLSTSEKEQLDRELHSLNVAIGANIVIMFAKVWVHIISGSSSMLAEAMHSLADIMNQILLRVGVLQAVRAPSPQYQYGYMRDRFVWSLISAVGIFFLGAGASVFHGLHTLAETRVVEGAGWTYLVLGVSGILEGYSLWVAARYVMAGAAAKRMGFIQYIKAGVDPTTVAVMLEDGGAVAGLLIAGGCTALTHATGNAMWDAVGSIMVGGLLGLIAVFLVQKNRDLLLGRSMNSAETRVILDHLARDPVVQMVTDAKSEEVGPRVYRFKAEVAWNSDALVDRYLKRCGRDVLVQRLREAIAEEERLAALGAHRPGHGPPGVPGAGAGQGGMVDTGGRPVLPVDIVLKAYSRSIISAVGAEVDRIEAEIQAINPGIRWVDLETDRGRVPAHIFLPITPNPTPSPSDTSAPTDPKAAAKLASKLSEFVSMPHSDPVMSGLAAAQALTQQQTAAAAAAAQGAVLTEGVLYDDMTLQRLQPRRHKSSIDDMCYVCDLPPFTPTAPPTTSAATAHSALHQTSLAAGGRHDDRLTYDCDPPHAAAGATAVTAAEAATPVTLVAAEATTAAARVAAATKQQRQ